MQRKFISYSSLNARKAAIFPLSIQWIHSCILPLNAAMYWTHLKIFHFFPAWRCLAGSNV